MNYVVYVYIYIHTGSHYITMFRYCKAVFPNFLMHGSVMPRYPSTKRMLVRFIFYSK